MQTSTTAALAVITHKVLANAPATFTYVAAATTAVELFTDAVDAAADIARVTGDGSRMGVELVKTFEELGFGSLVATNLMRAGVIFNDAKGRASDDYVKGVSVALLGSLSR